MVLDEQLTVGDVVGFHLKYLSFDCASDPELEEYRTVVAETTKKTINAFQYMMAGGRGFPEKKKQRYFVLTWWFYSSVWSSEKDFAFQNRKFT